MLKFLIPAAAITAMLYKYVGNVADAADRLQYSLKGAHFSIHLLKPSYIEATITITNPTRTALFYDRIDLQAKWNDTSIGSVVADKRTMIPANGSADAVFPFRIQGIGIIKAIVAAIKEGSPGKLTATGNIIAGLVKVPIEIVQDLEGLTK